MTTQAITDIKELVGDMPARACECELDTCPSRHAYDETCCGESKWVARLHGVSRSTGEHGEIVLSLCEACLTTLRAYVAGALVFKTHCSCGMPIDKWIGPVMPL
ncbi:Uncharacterised protein [Mycobacteroides abscessus subsp. abscessus]|nr:Uncharacterised protein [Mycobacteroides abscessus subsp. abscessus]